MSFTPRSGKNAVVRIGTTVVTCHDWSVDYSADELPVDNFEDGGFGRTTTGLLRAKITLEMDADSAANPYDSPIALNPGTVVTNLKCYLNGTSNAFWLFPTAVVLTAPQKAGVKGTISNTFTLASQGVFSQPGGTF